MRGLWRSIVLLGLLAPVGWGTPVWGQGYEVVGNSLVISRGTHWQEWKILNSYLRPWEKAPAETPVGDVLKAPVPLVEISDEGVRPYFVGMHTGDVEGINASLDATSFLYEDTVLKLKTPVRGGIRNMASRNLALRIQNRESVSGEERVWPFAHPQIGFDEADHSWKPAVLMDGDQATWWEPDLSLPESQWWIEVDLGRLVHARKIVVRFVDEELGDPFKRFQVYIGNGEKAFVKDAQSITLDYRLIWTSLRLSGDQRVFEIPLEPLDRASPEYEGAAIHNIRIQVIDSDRDRAHRITEAEYTALPEGERGAIEYLRRLPSEGVREITGEEYEALPEGERGGIRYYRRERPRLAEVEVWATGQNIALLLETRGGKSWEETSVGESERLEPFDGYFRTEWRADSWDRYRRSSWLRVDLGGLFWVSGVYIILRESDVYKAFDGYILRSSMDGVVWEGVSADDRLQIEGGKYTGWMRIADPLPAPRKVRLLDLRNIDITGRHTAQYNWGAALVELQAYGEGYVPEVILVSDWMDLGATRSLSSMSWEAEIPPGTEVELYTMTAEGTEEVHHYYDRIGKEITEEEWYGLKERYRGKHTVETRIIGASGWSSPYKLSGTSSPAPVLSPSPTPFFRIKVRLLSEDPYQFALLKRIEVHFSQPLVEALSGEVGWRREDAYVPPEGIEPVRELPFSYFIRSRLSPTLAGFQEVRLVGLPQFTPEAVRVGWISEDTLLVRPGEEPEILRGLRSTSVPGRFRSPSGDTLAVVDTVGTTSTSFRLGIERVVFEEKIDLTLDSDRLISTAPDTLWVHFPQRVRYQAGKGDALLELAFWSSMPVGPLPVRGEVGAGDIWQGVLMGRDATRLVAGQSAAISVGTVGEVLSPITLSPRVFTPNGDGHNDQTEVEFALLKVRSPVRVEVQVVGTDGGIIWRERREELRAGKQVFIWKGRDSEGHRVPPGVYIVQVMAFPDQGEVRRLSPLYVIY